MNDDNRKNKFEYVDALSTKHTITFYPREYNSLMEMLWDNCIEEWGDCKGRAWCGTCHIKVSDIHSLDPMNQTEALRLEQLSNVCNNSRLACQIPMDQSIIDLTFTYIGDD